jgi:predicted metal-dependent hydrolase
MRTTLTVGGVRFDVVRKDIKNVHLSVLPPKGAVRIAAPLRMSPDTIRVFAIAKLDWIRNQQKKLREQERETPREYIDRESHYLWGRRYLLEVREVDHLPGVEIGKSKLVLMVRPGCNGARRQATMDAWYREQIKLAVPDLVSEWEPVLGVKVRRVFVQKMKTKWGSCSAATGGIRLNSELAKKPRECLEYIVVHEMVHLLEPTHNERFVGLMNLFLPNWVQIRQTLNRLPVRHETWTY